ncbi:MAG: trehalase, partial [Chlamydiia bacterium]|nr:trehalase [Chlamydiia bacterium]
MKLKDYIQLSGPLFEAVQLRQVFPDGKTFVDATPKGDPKEILEAYARETETPGFNLKAFVLQHFDLPKEESLPLPNAQTMEDYIKALWPLLRREMKASSEKSTLISLPHPHIVPGGRFRECFYWDSYFTALGLPLPIIKEMVENFASLIERFGMIPNGNRVYFATRSQPPDFSHLLTLLIEKGEEPFARLFA